MTKGDGLVARPKSFPSRSARALPVLPALAHNQSPVIGLLARTKHPDILNHRPHEARRILLTVPPQRFDQPLLPEFLPRIVERFGDTVGVKCQRIATTKRIFSGCALPLFKKPQHG